MNYFLLKKIYKMGIIKNLILQFKKSTLEDLNKVENEILLIKAEALELAGTFNSYKSEIEKAENIESIQERKNKSYITYVKNLSELKNRVEILEKSRINMLKNKFLQKEKFGEIMKSFYSGGLKNSRGEIIENRKEALKVAFDKSKLNISDFEKAVVTINKGFKEGIIQKEEFEKAKQALKGGLADNMTLQKIADKHKVSIEEIKEQLKKGMKVEREHTNDPKKAREIAMDHLMENSKYYDKLETIEKGDKDILEKSENIEIIKYSDAIVRDKDDKILFLRRSKEIDFEEGKLGLPGGHLDEGEEFEQAAIRELLEETGLKAYSAIEVYIYKEDKVEIHYFECEVKEPYLITLDNSEHKNEVWLGIDDWEGEEFIKNLKENLREIYMDDQVEQLEQVDVSYQDEGYLDRYCKDCGWFKGLGLCKLVKGEIKDNGYCKMWGTLQLSGIIEKGEEDKLNKPKKLKTKKQLKVEKVMNEFKEGKLKSSGGEVITDRKQAIAIAISESKKV
jgi:8-oxo-dGTP pyrophosphatase MutT (NUDIX family)